MTLVSPSIKFVAIANGPVYQTSVRDLTHERFQPGLCSGFLELNLENLGYLLVAAGRAEDGSPLDRDAPKTFVQREGQPVIPGSTLKGAIRSLFETVTHSCLRMVSQRYGNRNEILSEPGRFEPLRSTPSLKGCQNYRELCPACLLFGVLNGSTTWLGRVRISDATLSNGPAQYVKNQAMPKQEAPRPKARPGTTQFTDYYPNQRMAGRKFYQREKGSGKLVQVPQRGGRGPQAAEPLKPGHHFGFRVDYRNLKPEELGALLAVLVLPPGWVHAIGAAKNHGWGNCRIEVKRWRELDPLSRYSGKPEGPTLEGQALADRVQEQIERAKTTKLIKAQAFNELEQILKP